jgi:hypothetical protein
MRRSGGNVTSTIGVLLSKDSTGYMVSSYRGASIGQMKKFVKTIS